MAGTDFNHKLKKGGEEAHLGGYDMVRRVGPTGEALVWCRKCSGYARVRLAPELMNRCRLEKKDTKEDWTMLTRILKLEEGRGARQKRERVES